jgi:hypothetical protein
MTPQKLIEATSAIEATSIAGRYAGGTFVHKEIAYEFAVRESVEFKLYLVKESDRLKVAEQHQPSRKWKL